MPNLKLEICLLGEKFLQEIDKLVFLVISNRAALSFHF